MRVIVVASIVFVGALTFVTSGFGPAVTAQQLARQSGDDDERRHRHGQAIFRYDTFGDEQFWTTVLRMHEVLPTVDPDDGTGVGLKVDVEALPRDDRGAQRRAGGPHGSRSHDRAARLNAVVGVRGRVDDDRRAHERGHHVCAVSLDGGRFAHAPASAVVSTDGPIAT